MEAEVRSGARAEDSAKGRGGAETPLEPEAPPERFAVDDADGCEAERSFRDDAHLVTRCSS